MNKDVLIRKLYEACVGARNHLEACTAGRIRDGGESASYPLVVEAIDLVNAYNVDPHMTVRQMIEKLSKCDWDALVFVGAHNKDMNLPFGLDTNPATLITENRQSIHADLGVSCVHITSV